MASSIRQSIVAANWKAGRPGDSFFVSKLARKYPSTATQNGPEIIIFPDFLKIGSVGFDLKRSRVRYGAQNVFYEGGAYTGELSPEMLQEAGCAYCLVGHSERRQHFNETEVMVNLKVKALLSVDIVPVICVGESLEVRVMGDDVASAYVIAMLGVMLNGLSPEQVARLVIAYEPIWAIGAGRTATPEQADKMCAAIRQYIAERFGQYAADNIRIIYGGSVKAENAASFAAMPNIDGALVGAASLNREEFGEIVEAFRQ